MSKKMSKMCKKKSKKMSKKMSKMCKKMSGGAKKSSKKASKKSKKASKKSKKASKKSKKSRKMKGGSNDGFKAFLELKTKIAKDLGVANGPAPGKVAAAVQKEIKEKHMGSDGKPTIPSVEVSKQAYDLFKSNMDKYKKFLN
jgi:hypothetical protein